MSENLSERARQVAIKLADIIQRYGDNGFISCDNYDAIPESRPSRNTIRRYLGTWQNAIGLCRQLADRNDDLVSMNVQLAKKVQRFADSNRIERKAFREHARIENVLVEYNKELIRIFKRNALHDGHNALSVQKNNAVGIIQLSDIHFNELINFGTNKYNFEIASARIRKLIYRAKRYFALYDIADVLVALTGDLMNSDRRIDELLNQTTNRSKATFLAVDILQQALRDVAENYNVKVACVTGNESRIGRDIEWSDLSVTDNYDYTIFNILKYLFINSERVQFIDGDPSEQVVRICDKNILLIHGHQIKSKTEESVQKIKGKYVARGINIAYILFGHLHSCRIGDTYARSSSVAGANEYSDRGLQLDSRASQNIHIIMEDGSIDNVRIDLQETDDIEPYAINTKLSAYNTKSASILHDNIKILTITV
jgi:predicted phosphodiesterase